MDVYVAHRPARTEENSSRFLIIDLTLHTENLTNTQTKYLVDCLQTLYDGSCKLDKGVTIWNKGLINAEKTNVGMINGFVLFKIKLQKLHPSHLPNLQPFIAFDKSVPNGTCTTFTAATASTSIPESPSLDKHKKSEKIENGKLYRVSPPYIGVIGKDAGTFLDGGYHFVPLDFGNDEHNLLASLAFPGKSGWKIFEEPEEDSDDSDEEEEEEEEEKKEEKKEEEQKQEEEKEENNDNEEEEKDSDTRSNSSAGSNDSDNCVIC
ncbi:hypothetical protein BKA69DRAFT_1100239 [Paraphysoderma sedebokerense]|nr:hypothetical protein BKA69DRAFT_1100239 [Paraphysoderma sedebokerense]